MTKSNSQKPLGILAALPQELEALLPHLKEAVPIQRGRETFTRGILEGLPVMVTLSGMGKVHAAVAAQRLISEFNAQALFFTGVAGATNPKWQVGDILLARHTFQHDFGFLGKELRVHPPGILPELQIGTGQEPLMIELEKTWTRLTASGENFLQLAKEIFRQQQSTLQSVTDLRTPLLEWGTIATGDQFIASEEKKKTLHEHLRADAVEMEGAAVAQVATQNEVPCLLLRAISDTAGNEAHVDFHTLFQTVASNSARLLLALFSNPTVQRYFGN